MINFVKGCNIANPQQLHEAYNVEEDGICAIVDASKILKIIYDFIDMQSTDSHMFFFLEVPSKLDDENVTKEATDTEFGIIEGSVHKDVYYLDGVPISVIKKVIEPIEDVLLNDGFTCFGVGNHDTNDEIGKYTYNEIKLFSYSDNNYVELFSKNGVEEDPNIVFASDIINENNLGERTKYIDPRGRDIYKIVDDFKEVFGEDFYKAEQREDD